MTLRRKDDDAEVTASRRALQELAREVRDLRASKSWRITRPLRMLDDLLHGRRHREGVSSAAPEVGAAASLDWGDLARVTPVSSVWGFDRGLPVDRHYIARFLREHRGDIRGRVLEVKDPYYATSIGGMPAASVAVLDVDATNPNATVIVDLGSAAFDPPGEFDCFILTQTLHIIYDIHAAVRNAVRLLAPGGVLLCTVPAVSRVNYEDGGLESGDYWRFTAAAVRRLFADVAGLDSIEITTHGNVQVCAAFLYGVATEELDATTLAYSDPWFPLVHCIRAVRRHDAVR